jgi:hypothetical protein
MTSLDLEARTLRLADEAAEIRANRSIADRIALAQVYALLTLAATLRENG